VPELPEVETTRRGISPHITGKRVKTVVVRQNKLRWPITPGLKKALPGQEILSVTRRGKYLLLNATEGTVIIHLGMSGSLKLVESNQSPKNHDHVDIVFNNNQTLRLHDPRRFGAVLWTTSTPLKHPLLDSLGPEPLNDEFDTDYLFQRSRKKRVAIKTFIMNSKIVVGVGNIYASEALFRSGIRPTTAAGKISKTRYQRLVKAIKDVLQAAIAEGGTTLRDFTNGEGKPGYFKQKLLVYGRAGEPCTVCNKTIKHSQQNQRATYYCSHCQR
jgi:formamidopyrimidine-DNA glycosylase